MAFPSAARSLLMPAFLLCTLGMGGCYFGNTVQVAPQSETPDPLSGYYEAKPVSLKFCATHLTSPYDEAPPQPKPTPTPNTTPSPLPSPSTSPQPTVSPSPSASPTSIALSQLTDFPIFSPSLSASLFDPLFDRHLETPAPAPMQLISASPSKNAMLPNLKSGLNTNSAGLDVDSKESQTTQCQLVSTTQIPRLVAERITNPLALYYFDPEGGRAVLANPAIKVTHPGQGLMVWVSPQGATKEQVPHSTVLSGYDAELRWDASECTISEYTIEGHGNITKRAAGQPVNQAIVNGRKVSLLGRVSLTAFWIRSFSGYCGNQAAAMQKCYERSSDCGGATDRENAELQQEIHFLLDEFIKAGVLTPSQISSLSNLSYEVVYE